MLLGLTATPERMDGKKILEHFDDRIASEMRLPEAIDHDLRISAHRKLMANEIKVIFSVDVYNEDCETLGHTTKFKRNAANTIFGRISFKFLLYFSYKSI